MLRALLRLSVPVKRGCRRNISVLRYVTRKRYIEKYSFDIPRMVSPNDWSSPVYEANREKKELLEDATSVLRGSAAVNTLYDVGRKRLSGYALRVWNQRVREYESEMHRTAMEIAKDLWTPILPDLDRVIDFPDWVTGVEILLRAAVKFQYDEKNHDARTLAGYKYWEEALALESEHRKNVMERLSKKETLTEDDSKLQSSYKSSDNVPEINCFEDLLVTSLENPEYSWLSPNEQHFLSLTLSGVKSPEDLKGLAEYCDLVDKRLEKQVLWKQSQQRRDHLRKIQELHEQTLRLRCLLYGYDLDSIADILYNQYFSTYTRNSNSSEIPVSSKKNVYTALYNNKQSYLADSAENAKKLVLDRLNSFDSILRHLQMDDKILHMFQALGRSFNHLNRDLPRLSLFRLMYPNQTITTIQELCKYRWDLPIEEICEIAKLHIHDIPMDREDVLDILSSQPNFSSCPDSFKSMFQRVSVREMLSMKKLYSLNEDEPSNRQFILDHFKQQLQGFIENMEGLIESLESEQSKISPQINRLKDVVSSLKTLSLNGNSSLQSFPPMKRIHEYLEQSVEAFVNVTMQQQTSTGEPLSPFEKEEEKDDYESKIFTKPMENSAGTDLEKSLPPIQSLEGLDSTDPLVQEVLDADTAMLGILSESRAMPDVLEVASWLRAETNAKLEVIRLYYQKLRQLESMPPHQGNSNFVTMRLEKVKSSQYQAEFLEDLIELGAHFSYLKEFLESELSKDESSLELTEKIEDHASVLVNLDNRNKVQDWIDIQENDRAFGKEGFKNFVGKLSPFSSILDNPDGIPDWQKYIEFPAVRRVIRELSERMKSEQTQNISPKTAEKGNEEIPTQEMCDTDKKFESFPTTSSADTIPLEYGPPDLSVFNEEFETVPDNTASSSKTCFVRGIPYFPNSSPLDNTPADDMFCTDPAYVPPPETETHLTPTELQALLKDASPELKKDLESLPNLADDQQRDLRTKQPLRTSLELIHHYSKTEWRPQIDAATIKQQFATRNLLRYRAILPQERKHIAATREYLESIPTFPVNTELQHVQQSIVENKQFSDCVSLLNFIVSDEGLYGHEETISLQRVSKQLETSVPPSDMPEVIKSFQYQPDQKSISSKRISSELEDQRQLQIEFDQPTFMEIIEGSGRQAVGTLYQRSKWLDDCFKQAIHNNRKDTGQDDYPLKFIYSDKNASSAHKPFKEQLCEKILDIAENPITTPTHQKIMIRSDFQRLSPHILQDQNDNPSSSPTSSQQKNSSHLEARLQQNRRILYILVKNDLVTDKYALRRMIDRGVPIHPLDVLDLNRPEAVARYLSEFPEDFFSEDDYLFKMLGSIQNNELETKLIGLLESNRLDPDEEEPSMSHQTILGEVNQSIESYRQTVKILEEDHPLSREEEEVTQILSMDPSELSKTHPELVGMTAEQLISNRRKILTRLFDPVESLRTLKKIRTLSIGELTELVNELHAVNIHKDASPEVKFIASSLLSLIYEPKFIGSEEKSNALKSSVPPELIDSSVLDLAEKLNHPENLILRVIHYLVNREEYNKQSYPSVTDDIPKLATALQNLTLENSLKIAELVRSRDIKGIVSLISELGIFSAFPHQEQAYRNLMEARKELEQQCLRYTVVIRNILSSKNTAHKHHSWEHRTDLDKPYHYIHRQDRPLQNAYPPRLHQLHMINTLNMLKKRMLERFTFEQDKIDRYITHLRLKLLNNRWIEQDVYDMNDFQIMESTWEELSPSVKTKIRKQIELEGQYDHLDDKVSSSSRNDVSLSGDAQEHDSTSSINSAFLTKVIHSILNKRTINFHVQVLSNAISVPNRRMVQEYVIDKELHESQRKALSDPEKIFNDRIERAIELKDIKDSAFTSDVIAKQMSEFSYEESSASAMTPSDVTDQMKYELYHHLQQDIRPFFTVQPLRLSTTTPLGRILSSPERADSSDLLYNSTFDDKIYKQFVKSSTGSMEGSACQDTFEEPPVDPLPPLGEFWSLDDPNHFGCHHWRDVHSHKNGAMWLRIEPGTFLFDGLQYKVERVCMILFDQGKLFLSERRLNIKEHVSDDLNLEQVREFVEAKAHPKNIEEVLLAKYDSKNADQDEPVQIQDHLQSFLIQQNLNNYKPVPAHHAKNPQPVVRQRVFSIPSNLLISLKKLLWPVSQDDMNKLYEPSKRKRKRQEKVEEFSSPSMRPQFHLEILEARIQKAHEEYENLFKRPLDESMIKLSDSPLFRVSPPCEKKKKKNHKDDFFNNNNKN